MSLAAGAVLILSLAFDPYQIFERAEQVWQSQHYPSVVNYVVHVQTVRHKKAKERHYLMRWSALNDSLLIDPISVEERRDPYVPPPGFDVGIPLLHLGHIGGPNEGSGTNGDLIGVPILAPNYSFGIARYVPPALLTPAQIVAEIRAEYHDPAPEKIAELEREYPKTIASVFVASAVYKILLVGIEAIGAHSDYHLSLAPIHDPDKYRLRDLWIDQATYATDKLRSDGNFIDRGTSGVPWTVTFQNVGGAQFIDREIAERPIRHWFDSIAISFENVEPGSGHFEAWPFTGTTIREP